MAVAPRGDNRRKAIATRCSDSAPGLADVLADRARRSRSLRYGFVRSYSAGSSSEICRRESHPGVAISVARTIIVCGESVREIATCDCVYGFVSHLYPLDAIDALPASSRVCGSAERRAGGIVRRLGSTAKRATTKQTPVTDGSSAVDRQAVRCRCADGNQMMVVWAAQVYRRALEHSPVRLTMRRMRSGSWMLPRARAATHRALLVRGRLLFGLRCCVRRRIRRCVCGCRLRCR